MNYKSTIFAFLFFFIAFGINAANSPSAIKPGAPVSANEAPSMTDAQGNPVLPPGMTEEDMKAFAEFIESLDPETIEALTTIGEEIIKEADELGMDPFEYIELQAQMQQEYDDKNAKEETSKPKVAPAQPTKTTVISVESQTIQELLKNIISVIVSIRQKSATDSYFAQELAPFKYRLDDLVYFFTLLSQEKMIKYLSDPEFTPLIENLKKFYKQIAELDELFVVKEFSLEGDNPYDILDLSRSASQQEIVKAYNALIKKNDPNLIELQLIREGKPEQEIKKEVSKAQAQFETINTAYADLRAKEESLVIFNRILDAISQAIDVNKIIDESKKIIQKYEPDALKEKQEQEKIEAEARKKQEEYLKKRPIISRSFAMPPARKPSSDYKKKSYDFLGDDYGGSYAPSGKSKSPEQSRLPKPGTPSKGKPGSKDDKKKDDKKKKKDADKKDGAKGAPTKAPDKGGKKELTADIAEAIGGLKGQFRSINDTLKKNEITKDKGSVFKFLTEKPFSLVEEEAKKDKDAAVALMTDLTGKFTGINGSIKRTEKKFKDNKEKLKDFKVAAAKVVQDFEDSDEFKSISQLLRMDDKGNFFFNEKSPNIRPPVEKKGDPEKKAENIVPAKNNFIFTASKPAEAGQKPNAPYIKLLRDSYKAIKDKVKSSGDQGLPVYQHVAPPPGPSSAPAPEAEEPEESEEEEEAPTPTDIP